MIYVTSAVDKETSNVLYQPKEKVPVARVYPLPRLTKNYRPSKIKANEPDFTITGEGFSTKDTSLVFDPPIKAGEEYDYAINDAGTQIFMSLKRGKVWREDAGPLSVVAIIGEPGRLTMDEPVEVAMISISEDGINNEFESIESPSEPYTIYRTYRGTNMISIKGSGFQADRPPLLEFKGDAAIQDQDFDLEVKSSNELVLRLHKDSAWLTSPGMLILSHLNGERLPSPIIIADVYETPTVNRNKKQLVYETQTITVVVEGAGFVAEETSIGLNPEMEAGVDYYVEVRDDNTLEIELMQGKKWKKGILSVTWVQVGKGSKVYQNLDQPEKGIRVAVVESDFKGQVSIEASSQRVYQSETPTISVSVLVLPPKFQLKEGEDVSVQVGFSASEGTRAVSGSRVEASIVTSESNVAILHFKLKDPSEDKWLDSDGTLFLSSITIEGSDGKKTRFPLTSGSGDDKQGVQIARVLPDIRVHLVKPPPTVFMTQSQIIPIKGSGFTYSLTTILEDFDEDEEQSGQYVDRPQPIVLDPPLVQEVDFLVTYKSSELLYLELMEEARWRQSSGLLVLVSIDSGAGPVFVNEPVAKVADDDPGMICTNDCPYETPFDGICGDMHPEPGGFELACWGKDCYDCGPRKKNEKPAAANSDPLCSDTCGEIYVKDGICEDGRPGVWSAQCPLCSDCSDCGPCPEGKYSNLQFCTNGAEGSPNELVPGLPCSFPFTYQGVFYDGSQCVKDDRVGGGWGWCPTTEDFERDQKWGSCQYCVDVVDEPGLYKDDDYYLNTIQDNSIKGSKMMKRAKSGFNFSRWIVQTLLFFIFFIFVGYVGLRVYRSRSSQYHLVSNKAF